MFGKAKQIAQMESWLGEETLSIAHKYKNQFLSANGRLERERVLAAIVSAYERKFGDVRDTMLFKKVSSDYKWLVSAWT